MELQIIRLEGTDKRLYDYVAPLVMNPAILRQNNNYPFKTSVRHTWYLALENDTVMGFMPLRRDTLRIDNYHISGDDARVLDVLLERLLGDFGEEGVLTAMVHKRHVKAFAARGFKSAVEWVKYERMVHLPRRTKRRKEAAS